MSDIDPRGDTTTPVAVLDSAVAVTPRSGLAFAALVIGIVAAVMSIIPFVSFLAFVPAFVAMGLGIAAVAKKVCRGRAVAALILGTFAFVLAIAVSAASVNIINGVSSATNQVANQESAVAAGDAPTTAPSNSPSASPSAKPSKPAPAPATVPADMAYSGSGDSVISIELPDGLTSAAVATITHAGSSNFAVWSLDSGMSESDLLVNEIGDYSGTVVFNLQGEGVTSLEITADGAWTITLRSVLSLREFAEGGANGAGDDVLVYRGKAGVAMISHDGSSNFTVWNYASRTDLAVNEIGAYSGSMRWSAGPSLVAVSADGNWSILVSWK